MSKVESLTAVVWRHAPSKYSGTPLVVLLKIAGLTEAKDGHAHVRIHILAQMCGVTERRAQQIVEDLKEDRILRVQYRKGKSSVFHLNIDLLRGLPLAVKPVEQTSDEPKVTEPATANPSDAQFISELLTKSFTKKELPIPDDWQNSWPVEFQKLLDAGHTVDAIRDVARFALSVECHREELAKHGPAMLVEKFAPLLELSETFGSKEVAA
jgi:hypothetical protein